MQLVSKQDTLTRFVSLPKKENSIRRLLRALICKNAKPDAVKGDRGWGMSDSYGNGILLCGHTMRGSGYPLGVFRLARRGGVLSSLSVWLKA